MAAILQAFLKYFWNEHMRILQNIAVNGVPKGKKGPTICHCFWN